MPSEKFKHLYDGVHSKNRKKKSTPKKPKHLSNYLPTFLVREKNVARTGSETCRKIDRKLVKVQKISGICRHLQQNRYYSLLLVYNSLFSSHYLPHTFACHWAKKAINLIEHANWFARLQPNKMITRNGLKWKGKKVINTDYDAVCVCLHANP